MTSRLRRRSSVRIPSSGPTYDVDAAAYFSAYNITNTTEKNLANTVFVDLKAASLYTKFVRLNLDSPTSSTAALGCAVSLTNSTNTNSVSYSTSGWTFNCTNNYLNLNYATAAPITNQNFSAGIYLNQGTLNAFGTGSIFGVVTNPVSRRTQILFNGDVADFSLTAYSFATTTAVTSSNPDLSLIGFWSYSKNANNSLSLYKNGSLLQNASTTGTETLPTNNIFIGCVDSIGSPTSFLDVTVLPRRSTFFVAQKLNNSEMATVVSILQTYNTGLGR